MDTSFLRCCIIFSNCVGFGMLGSHGLNIIDDLQEYRVSADTI